ncbi:MAG: RsiV family protein [Muribaculaceae bacterium]
MKHILISASALLLGALSATSYAATNPCCSSAPGNISFDTFKTSAVYQLYGSARALQHSTDATYSQTVAIVVPTAIGTADLTELNDSIMSLAFNSKGQSFNDAAAAWCRAAIKETGYPVIPSDVPLADATGFDAVSGMVTNLLPDLMVYCVNSSYYTVGAAHGMSVNYYLNYSIKEGKLLSLKKMFTAEGLRKLPALIAGNAKENEAVFGPTDIKSLPDRDNFYISDRGEIVFAYQPYEVAPYAQGQINVAFYPYELEQYLTPEAKSALGL